MTNIKSAFGAGAWGVVATLLLLATFEPVKIAPEAPQIAAAPAAAAAG
jgi:hypothetical protein